MSERKARAARRPPPDNGHQQPDDAAAAVQEAIEGPGQPVDQQIPFPGVLVFRVPGEQPGQEQIQMAEINGIDPLSVPTLLRVAANIKEQQLGLPGKS